MTNSVYIKKDKMKHAEDVAKIKPLEQFGIDTCGVSWEDLFKEHLCYDAIELECCCPPEDVNVYKDNNSIIPVPGESIYQYRLTIPPRFFGDPGGRVDYIDENGDAKFKAWFACNDARNCESFSFVFCAQYGSFTNSTTGTTPLGAVTHAFNEPCPVGAIQCISDPGLERLNDCPN
jgi:hypothetical protein